MYDIALLRSRVGIIFGRFGSRRAVSAVLMQLEYFLILDSELCYIYRWTFLNVGQFMNLKQLCKGDVWKYVCRNKWIFIYFKNSFISVIVLFHIWIVYLFHQPCHSQEHSSERCVNAPTSTSNNLNLEEYECF